MGKINTPYTPESFWDTVDTGGSGCWEWSRFRNKAGYGYFKWKSKLTMAHRVAYELAIGEIPDGMYVLHKCDNPPCCNPDHLWLGTKDDNNKDKKAKNRGRSAPKKLDAPRAALLKWDLVHGFGFRETARKFGVSLPTVLYICDGKAWRYV